MEETEGEKFVYWGVFFVIIIIIAVGGYFLTFGNKKEDNKPKKEETKEEYNYGKYRGKWLLKDGEEINEELDINSIDSSKVEFNYSINDIVSFEKQTALLEGASAEFDITTLDGQIELSGRLVFREDKIVLVITDTNSDDISLGSIEFTEKE